MDRPWWEWGEDLDVIHWVHYAEHPRELHQVLHCSEVVHFLRNGLDNLDQENQREQLTKSLKVQLELTILIMDLMGIGEWPPCLKNCLEAVMNRCPTVSSPTLQSKYDTVLYLLSLQEQLRSSWALRNGLNCFPELVNDLAGFRIL